VTRGEKGCLTAFGIVLAVCALVILGGYVAWSILFPTIDIRYRLTLDVDIDGVRHSGSGVVEIEYDTSAALIREFVTGGAQGLAGSMHGNAITVDLGDRGLLFVVNNLPCFNAGTPPIFGKASTLADLPLTLYQNRTHARAQGQVTFLRGAQHMTGIIDLLPQQLPMLIRFRDIQDGSSAQAVDPRDLTRAFGPGAKLAGATFQVTSDPITVSPSSWPKWLIEENGDTRLFFRNDNGKIQRGGCYLSVGMFKEPL
jgi:hypothetical protein